MVRFEADAAPAERAADLAARGLTVVDELPGSDHVLVLPTTGSVRAAGVADDVIEDIAPLVTVRAFGVPNDPAYRAQWHLPAIDAASAWDVTTGTGTVVAVIDTGVAYETYGGYLQAPDLAGTSFAAGWDFVSGDAHPNDDNGHGTHVTGTIAQTTNNGVAAAGVAPGVTIMPLRALDANGAGSDWNVAQALRFAADHGADVVNLSLGSNQASSVLADAVAYAHGRGVTVVAASGNDGVGTVSYPAAFDGAIAVGAVRVDLTRPSYANYGTKLDLVAPGGDLSVDQDGNGYGDGILQQTLKVAPDQFCLCFLQGTSMATPQVSAVAALVAARGVTDPATIESVLVATAVDLGTPGRDDVYGNGLVQSGAAVRAAMPPSAPSSGTSPAPAPAPTPTAPAPALAPAPAPAPAPLPAPALPPERKPATPVPSAPSAPASARGIEHACPSGTTPPTSFLDVATSVHANAIACVAWWGVANGRSAAAFEPGQTVNRGQLASFVARTLEVSGVALPADPADAFSDAATSLHARRINQLAAVGVVSGRSDGTFAPDAVVSRAEMATFLVRAHDAVVSVPLAAGGDRFEDDDDSVHQGNIDKVAAAGLAAGTGATTFAPGSPVLRGQMATFLARSLDLFVERGAVDAR